MINRCIDVTYELKPIYCEAIITRAEQSQKVVEQVHCPDWCTVLCPS